MELLLKRDRRFFSSSNPHFFLHILLFCPRESSKTFFNLVMDPKNPYSYPYDIVELKTGRDFHLSISTIAIKTLQNVIASVCYLTIMIISTVVVLVELMICQESHSLLVDLSKRMKNYVFRMVTIFGQTGKTRRYIPLIRISAKNHQKDIPHPTTS